MYLKIKNILLNDGTIGYKGLNINEFVRGSQVYPNDCSFALIKTTQKISELPIDVFVLTEEEYLSEKRMIENTKPISPIEEKIAQLEAENAQINYALMMGGLI